MVVYGKIIQWSLGSIDGNSSLVIIIDTYPPESECFKNPLHRFINTPLPLNLRRMYQSYPNLSTLIVIPYILTCSTQKFLHICQLTRQCHKPYLPLRRVLIDSQYNLSHLLQIQYSILLVFAVIQTRPYTVLEGTLSPDSVEVLGEGGVLYWNLLEGWLGGQGYWHGWQRLSATLGGTLILVG